MSVTRGLALIVAGTLVGVLVFGALERLRPPLEVRGDDRARPLEAAIADFDPDDVVSVLPRDGIAAIFDAETRPGREAELADDDRVIGVEVAGQALAYPINVLSAHEVANDEAGGVPFAVTW